MRPTKFRQPVTKNGEFVEWHYWGYLEKDNLAMFTSPLSSNDGEIKQSYEYTGLHDKNKVEIYEGDIIRYPEFVPESTQTHEIAEIKWGEAEWMRGELALNCEIFVDNKAIEVEIIGNIYENSDLLK